MLGHRDDASLGFGFDQDESGTGGRLTSRQRAMRGQADELEFLELPAPEGRKKKELAAEEAALRRSEKARRRKMLAKKHEEEAKNQTIRMLLNTQERPREGEDSKGGSKRTHRLDVAHIRETMQRESTTLSFTEDAVPYTCMPENMTTSAPPPMRLCGVQSCQRPRRYVDATTNTPLCSLQCYKALHMHMVVAP
eukprot:comp20194_c1_seq2/m.25079 comp20194_c1_seq2/g.25079  ORF comp20194_c1_seq2/g.25079 comp20194_c1_seq2/m.25079 type:complete len:194 (-) comp20194_c1_seq2:179-760(-)